MAPAARPTSLQQTASAVFAVTTVVPLLIFVWTLHRLGALGQAQSQVGLGLALGIALLGFYIFRRLMGQMSLLIQGLGRVVQQGRRPAGDQGSAAEPPRVPVPIFLPKWSTPRTKQDSVCANVLSTFISA